MNIEIDSLQLHFQVFGQGQPLVLLHGWGDSAASWETVAHLLSPYFQVYALDLPGFGASDAPLSPWSVEEYRSCVEKFIEEMEIRDPVLVGHSHGGKIACELLRHGLNAKGLVLVASAGLDAPSLKVLAKIRSFKLAKWLLGFCGEWGQKQIEKMRAALGSQDYKDAGGVLRQTMVKVVNHKLFSSLGSILTPTLIIWGSNDSTLPMEQAKLFRSRLKNSYIRVLWDATHHPHLEQPLELSRMLIDFSDVYEHQLLS